MKSVTFPIWIKKQHKRKDMVGVLAKQMRTDRCLPATGNLSTYKDHLLKHKAHKDALSVLEQAWYEFRSGGLSTPKIVKPNKKLTYSIVRPPLVKTFNLPSRADLLKLTTGDIVQLTFRPVGIDDTEMGGERMWVIIIQQPFYHTWVGKLDSHPVTIHKLKRGDLVEFNPFDIINVYPREKK